MILDANSICGLIDNNLAELIHTIIVILKFCIPILLVVLGMLDLGKGVIASKEDEIKKGQQMFIKRLISAVFVFFVVTIVQLVVGFVDDKNSGVMDCVNLILNGNKVESQSTNESQDQSETVPSENDNKKSIYLTCDLINHGYSFGQLKAEIEGNAKDSNCDIMISPIHDPLIKIESTKCLDDSKFNNKLTVLLEKYGCTKN